MFSPIALGTALGGGFQGFNAQQKAEDDRRYSALEQQYLTDKLLNVKRDHQIKSLLGALAGTPQGAALFGNLPFNAAPPMPGQASQPGQLNSYVPTPQGSGMSSGLPSANPFVGWGGGNTAPASTTGFIPGTWPTKYGDSSSNDYARGGAGDPGGDIDPGTGQRRPSGDAPTLVPGGGAQLARAGMDDGGGFSSPDDRRNFTLGYARQRGVDPRLVDTLVGTEGGWKNYDTTGDGGRSFGPFQDYTGGGLGNDFQSKGIEVDPRKPGFDERKVLKANVDYIADHGASPEVWHGLRHTPYGGGSGGGGGQLVGMRATTPDGGMLNPPIRRPPPSGYDLNNLATQLRQTNPNIDPETMFGVLEQYQHLMDKPSQEAWERFKFEVQEDDKDYTRREHRYEFDTQQQQSDRQFDIEQRRLDRSDLRSDRDYKLRQDEFEYRKKHGDEQVGGQGWEVLTDPTNNNKPYRFNKRTGEAVDFENKPYTPGGAGKVAAPNQQAFSPETMGGIVDAIGTYRAPPPSMSGWSGARAQQVMAEVIKKYPDYDATQFNARNRAAAAIGLRSGQLETQARVAEEEIPLTLATSEKIDRTQFPTINSMLLAVQKGTGDENVVQFLDQLNALKIVYASALNRSGVNTVDSMKRFDDILNAAWSKGQLRAALEQFQKTLAAERRGIDKAMTGSGTKGGAAAPAQAEPSGDIMDLPPAFQGDEDGQDYHFPDKPDETWVKKGNKLLKTPGAVSVPR